MCYSVEVPVELRCSKLCYQWAIAGSTTGQGLIYATGTAQFGSKASKVPAISLDPIAFRITMQELVQAYIFTRVLLKIG